MRKRCTQTRWLRQARQQTEPAQPDNGPLAFHELKPWLFGQMKNESSTPTRLNAAPSKTLGLRTGTVDDALHHRTRRPLC